jgi:hypothetical protein
MLLYFFFFLFDFIIQDRMCTGFIPFLNHSNKINHEKERRTVRGREREKACVSVSVCVCVE